jgi:hypothetical protein
MSSPFRLISFAVFSVLIFAQCQQEPYEINEDSASRILKTLSDDDMRGRQAGTEDAKKAAGFISSEFEAIGLQPLEGLEGYLQTFSMFGYTVTESSVTVSGNELSPDNYFGFVYESDLSWESGDAMSAVIAGGDNFQEKVQEYSDSDDNLLVFVDDAHSDIFGRYKGFFERRPSRSMEGENSPSIVMVLSAPSDDYSVSFTAEVEETKFSNVTGKIEGKRSDEIVLFSGHYDHIGIRTPVEGDSIANGANDDASGITAVIELARHFRSLGTPERTLMFTAFTAEEMGGFGSQYFSKQLNPDEIVAMFNIEMIGKPAVSGPNTAWITGFDRSSFGELLAKSTEGTEYEFYADPYPQQNLFYRSDNATLARLGVPAHSISTTPIDVDQDYHQVSDEYETIDISHMTNTIKAIATAAEGIVSGEDTPSRVDVTQVD